MKKLLLGALAALVFTCALFITIDSYFLRRGTMKLENPIFLNEIEEEVEAFMHFVAKYGKVYATMDTHASKFETFK